MELQAILPNEETTMDPGLLGELAVLAESLGYTAVWLPDHLLPPAPYGKTYGGVFEPLVTLAHLAARTSTIRLGTSVLVLPMRNPYVVAKQAATVHRLSEGRFILGIGAGWDRKEFASVGADFRRRGAVTDESIALLRALFRGETSFEGEFHRFEQGVFEPMPPQPVPIMVGGMSEAALKRAAALADEWQAVGVGPEEFGRLAARLAELRARAPSGRSLRVTARIEWPGDGSRAAEAVSTVASVASAVRAFGARGADAVAVWFGDSADVADRLALLAGELGIPADDR
ncbi:TIGR03619 family F420-dependent LLM class oxidoreductase [Saccharomonospora sp. NPDC006951]